MVEKQRNTKIRISFTKTPKIVRYLINLTCLPSIGNSFRGLRGILRLEIFRDNLNPTLKTENE